MNEQQALRKMIAPGMHRPVWRNGVLQIWVTRACDKACFGCTQGSNLAGKPGMITLEQFDQACASLKGYFGVVGMFGGNPAIHPRFEELCEIMASHIPWEQRGLWCNNLLGKGATARKTFNPAYSNINVHQDRTAFEEFQRDWPEVVVHGITKRGIEGDSRHSPVYVAMKDVIPDEAERWELISNCDINQTWSAMICVFRDELRAFFCEIAGAQAMLHQNESDYPDTGLKVTEGWWRKGMESFKEQVRKHCHECGVPLRGYGALANHGPVEQVSQTHAAIYHPKKEREVQIVTSREQLAEGSLPKMTDYLGNANR